MTRSLPAVAGVAAAEGDVLHLEEVAAVLELTRARGQARAARGHPAALPPLSARSPRPPLHLRRQPHAHLGSATQAQLDPPKRNLQVTGGGRAQVDCQLPGSGDLGKRPEGGVLRGTEGPHQSIRDTFDGPRHGPWNVPPGSWPTLSLRTSQPPLGTQAASLPFPQPGPRPPGPPPPRWPSSGELEGGAQVRGCPAPSLSIIGPAGQQVFPGPPPPPLSMTQPADTPGGFVGVGLGFQTRRGRERPVGSWGTH